MKMSSTHPSAIVTLAVRKVKGQGVGGEGGWGRRE